MCARGKIYTARCGCLLAGLIILIGSPEDAKAQFRVRVDTVSVDAEVLDSDGNPVPGLTEKDFTVKEDGRSMEITSFSQWIDRPVSLAIVLDTSAINLERLSVAKAHLFQMLHLLDRQDELCLYSFDNRDAYLEADLSTDRGLIIDALDNISVPSKQSGILREMMGSLPPTALGIDRALLNLRRARHAKRALLIISNRFRGLGPVTVDRIRDSGCTLFTLGFRNRAAVILTGAGDKINRDQMMRESGGRRFSAETEDIAGTCRAIVLALKNYYSIGYQTEIQPNDRKRRRIDVKIPGRDYVINARRSYFPQSD